MAQISVEIMRLPGSVLPANQQTGRDRVPAAVHGRSFPHTRNKKADVAFVGP